MWTVWAYSEQGDTALEVLAAGRALADQSRGIVVSIGLDDPACRIAHGADEAWRIPLPSDAPPPADVAARALLRAMEPEPPDVLLAGATRLGNEAMARVAQSLGVGCATGCTELAMGVGGELAVERRCYGGRLVARQALRGRPRMATVQPRRFEPLQPDPARRGVVRELPEDAAGPAVRVLSAEPRALGHRDIGKARALVAAGRGVRSREDLAMLEALAALLGGEVAGSRPLTDDLKWLPANVKVGLSGRTVRPDLYVACGISGQVEHVVGMRGARTVVSINADPDAPIHAEADYALVGDLYVLVPALIRALQERC